MHYTDQMSDGTATATAKQVGQTILHEWKVPGLWTD